LNKKELIEALEEASGQSKAACEAVIEALPGVLLGSIKDGGSTTLPGFVKVEAKKRDAREGRNPATGGTVKMPAKMVPAIKPTKPFKDAIAGMPLGK
jgi:DNA-binding protein HU-beta